MTLAFVAIAILSFTSCAAPEPKYRTHDLIPKGVQVDHASTLIIAYPLQPRTFDRKVISSEIPRDYNGSMWLMKAGSHLFTFGTVDASGEWFLSHPFEPGHKYRVIQVRDRDTVSAKLEKEEANGKWTLLREKLPASENSKFSADCFWKKGSSSLLNL